MTDNESKPDPETDTVARAAVEEFFQLFADGWKANDGAAVASFFVEDGALINPFGQRADGKFALPWMPDFADDEHVERPLQRARHAGGDDHAAARQSQHQVGLDPLFTQMLAEPMSRICS